ncbi:hypothetical protein [Sediminibacterium ginsengisoli]|uniref:SprT-like family protein n=1 Tax=Sediminibacterium ginsengisoli TaxID=413434 RepID=A0A1T4R9K0_9BACT|nr:hypothetical protein [Sediminibacterium ginsengisoli]SKA12311.1 hypothetical protein SAMN04488132_11127 [Sediminibacterium ginsengisoli]
MVYRLTKSKLFIAVLVGVGLIFYACRKNAVSGLSVQENITELQAWLRSNGLSYKSGEIAITNSNGVTAINKLNWELASAFKSRNNSYYEVPFVDEKDQRKHTGFSMVFQKNANEIVARVKHSYDNPNSGPAESGYSKVTIFDRLNGDNDASWAWYNGLNFPTKVYKKKVSSTTDIRIRTNSQNDIRTNVADDCRPLLVPVYNYECRSTYVDTPSHLTCGYYRVGYDLYTICFESPPGSSPGGSGGWPSPGGGGGGEGGAFNYDEYLEVNNRIIVDSLAGYPCAQNILAVMFNINDSIASVIKTLFGDTNYIDIRFQVDNNLAGTSTDAETRPGGSLSTFRATVKMNPDVLNNSTQEYIAVTFMHEALHAYIDYYLHLVDRKLVHQSVFSTLFPLFAVYRFDSLNTTELAQHNAMAETYVDMMTRFVKNMSPRVPDSVARALAWGGLYETTVWKLKTDTNSIKNINWTARDASLPDNKTWKLRKCP